MAAFLPARPLVPFWSAALTGQVVIKARRTRGRQGAQSDHRSLPIRLSSQASTSDFSHALMPGEIMWPG